MKVKLSVFILCLCSMTLFTTGLYSQNKHKVSTANLAKPIQDALLQKYPDAIFLDIDKEKNGTEVDILDKKVKKEVWFDTNNQWVSTSWDIKSNDVPVAVMEALLYSAYNQYKIDDITAIEKPSGMFYEFELKQNNNEVKVVFDANAQEVVQ